MTLPNDLPNNRDPDHRSRAGEAFFLRDALILPSLNRIEIQGEAQQIEPKVMKVLLALCARPGHVVYREQILMPVWGVTGDDYLLNRAISELRKIFGDNAQNPAYIETIRKTGYRLVAPIKPAASAALVTDNATRTGGLPTPTATEDPYTANTAIQPTARTENQATAKTRVNPGPKSPPEFIAETPAPAIEPGVAASLSAPSANLPGRRRPGARHWMLAMAGALGICAVIAIVFTRTGLFAKPEPFAINHYQVYPATLFAGREYDAALSPDGTRIAYVGEQPGQTGAVFVKMLRGEQALRVSEAGGQVSSPQWLPDGQGVAYLSLAGPQLRILRVSPMGGESQPLHQQEDVFGVRGMSIAPDGQHLVYAGRSAPNGPHQLWLVDIATGETRQLTAPQAGWLGDIDPLFTPDGRAVVFVRGSDEVTKDLHRLDLEGDTPTRLTHDNRKINGVALSPDATRLLFTSTRSGVYRLWAMPLEGGEPQPLALGWESVQRPATALGVEALVFEDWQHTAKLMRVNLADEPAPQPVPLKMSQRWDSNASLSVDGENLVFASNRGGPFAIWQGAVDDDLAYELTDLDGAFVDNPSWSPDGRQLLFDGSPEGRSRLYLLEQGTARPMPLPLGESDNRTPSWSRDGEWIYFESNRSGTWQPYAWHMPTGQVRAINLPAGKNPQESVDGRWLLAATAEGIRRCLKTQCLAASATVDAGAETASGELLIAGLREQDAYNWAPAGAGVYFVRRAADERAAPQLALYRYADGGTQTVTALEDNFQGWGMTLAPDESSVYFTEMTDQGTNIRVARP